MFADLDKCPDLAVAQACAAHALGRLEGRIAGLASAVARRFGFHLLRHILVVSLEDAGFADAGHAFAGWLAGGAPPQATPHVPAPADALSVALLAELRHHPWPPLADAAALLARAAPQFAPAGQGDAVAALAEVLEAARALVAAHAIGAPPLGPVAALVAAAARAAAFAPGARETTLLATPHGPRPVPLAAPRGALWALNLMLGPALALPVPLPRAITAEALRGDLDPDDRALAWTRSLATSADTLGTLLERARREETTAGPALAGLRSTARAPLVHAALIGLGPLGVAQLARGLGVTRLGATGMLRALADRGLVARGAGGWQAVAERGPPPEAPVARGALAEASQAVDAALADLDRLLARRR